MNNTDFRVHDDNGYDDYFATPEEAITAAAHRSLETGHCTWVDFLPYTVEAAEALGIEDYDPEDSVPLRLRITCANMGKIP